MSHQEEPRQAIASRLRLAREMAGLSQGQVARLSGWHRPTVSEIEAGRRRVSAEELSQLAELYGADVSWILGAGEEASTSERTRLAARELSKLNEEDLNRLLQVIQSLKRSGG